MDITAKVEFLGTKCVREELYNVHAYFIAEDFVGMVKTLGPAVIIIPLIAVLENMAIAKAFGKLMNAAFTRLYRPKIVFD